MITIIGVLIALLLPAVQAAREAARKTQCANHLKQIALGCLHHEQANGYLPTGGWGWGWSGDPDRGFTKKQPGGWMFNILPYIEQQPLHDLGLGNKQVGRTQTAATPVECFSCPTRRPCIPFTRLTDADHNYANIDNSLALVARSDYASNTGSGTPYVSSYGAVSLAAGDAISDLAWPDPNKGALGVIFVRSMCKIADITDGTSNTFLAGERNICPDYYFTGTSYDDNQGWTIGFDYNVSRWTSWLPGIPNSLFAPQPDTPGYPFTVNFGSAHANSFNMAFCDGSVHPINYSIDIDTLFRLGNRADGLLIDAKKY